MHPILSVPRLLLLAPLFLLFEAQPALAQEGYRTGYGWWWFWIVVAAIVIALIFWGTSSRRRMPPPTSRR